jgi:hypothetical protein
MTVLTHWINKSAQVKKNRIKCDDTCRLQRITVDNITAGDSIANLNSCRDCAIVSLFLELNCLKNSSLTEEECNLANDPMVVFIDADSPQNRPNYTISQVWSTWSPVKLTCSNQNGGVGQP